jgi:hypothetical protein
MRYLFIAVLAIALPLHAAMYKWVDAQGRVQYSDTPPPADAKKVEERRIIPNTIGTAGLPFAVQDAAPRNPVILWMHDCGELCNKARDYLARRGIPHTVRNPARIDEQEAWKKASGGDSAIPRLVVGNATPLKGFDEPQWAAALDAAGYPRTAAAMKPQAIPPAEVPPPTKPATAAAGEAQSASR